jgi:hypothetical protein
MRLIHSIAGKSSNRDKHEIEVKVHLNPEFAEFRVRLYREGRVYAAGDYFTSDKQDAIQTAEAILKTS